MTLSSVRSPDFRSETDRSPSAPSDHRPLEDPAGRWREWRATRAAELRRPHGWLSLTAFAWLSSTPVEVPGLPGRWSADDQAVTLTVRSADGLRPAEDSTGVLTGSVRFPVAEGESVLAVGHGDRRVELLRRAGRPALRVRDPHAATRTGFAGVPTHDWDGRWVVSARYVPAPEPVAEVVLTARPDLLTTAVTHGWLDFTVDGHPQSLAAAVAADGTLTVAFRDPTNEATTAPWRAVSTTAPDENRVVVVDFNRAVNLPFAVTPFGTCPAPVAANRITVPVTAGEKAPVAGGGAR